MCSLCRREAFALVAGLELIAITACILLGLARVRADRCHSVAPGVIMSRSGFSVGTRDRVVDDGNPEFSGGASKVIH